MVDLFRWHTYAVAGFMFISGYGTAVSFAEERDRYMQGYLGRVAKKLLIPLGGNFGYYGVLCH